MINNLHRIFSARRPIDLDTHVFEAGFSSSTLAEIVGELRAQGLTVSLLELFRHPTVRQLAGALGPPVRSAPPWLT